MFGVFYSKRYFFIILMIISFTSCGNLKDRPSPWSGNNVDVKKVIEAQMQLRDAVTEPEVVPKLSADEYAKRGDQFLRNNDTGSAFINYARALEAEPNNIRLIYAQALLLIEKRLYSAASLKLKRILKLEPENALAFEGLGRCYFGLKKPDEAEAAFAQAVKINASLWKSYSYLGLLAGRRKDFNASVANYRQAVALKPDNIELLNNLAVSYYLAADYSEAVELLTKAFQKKGADNRIFNNLALSYCRLEKYNEALKAFLATNDEAAAYNNIGYEYLLNRRYKDAVDAFEKAIIINPTFYEKAYNNLQAAQEAMKKQETDIKKR